MSGRNGKRDTNASESEAVAHADLVDGNGLVRDLEVDDVPHVDGSHGVESTHTAAPELTHPGESQ